ncbi:MAG TPA: bifunctional MaoC family dehydratase N-terminal/OB-fold nucleic acid binding domain-containing protein [Acidimicrobiia bacterium]|nr:bifunctional MaoC family dehydratase N-terminal/OB-fold nucleic acid binding domain-containing protein [Acidimicrobiia bacterium]
MATTTDAGTDNTAKAAFAARLKEFEGKEAGEPEQGADPVNQPMIRHWVEAVGDENPIYTQPEAAEKSVHGEIVAPPVMLQAWVMRGVRPRPTSGGNARDELMTLLDDAGFTSVVATNCEQEYHRYLHLGDHLSTTTIIESVSDEKATGLGVGHFVTTRVDYRTDDGELVATMRFRILKFKPGTGRSAAAEKEEQRERPLRPRPALTQDNAFWFEGARQHRLLIQRCKQCGTLRHPPRPMCSECRSYEWDVVDASGRGTVYSFVVNHYPQVPAFDYPLAVGLIELEEGTRLVANVIGVDPSDIQVGMPVEVEWVDHDPDLSLPAFRPSVPSGKRSRK